MGKLNIEAIVLAIFFALFLFLGPGNLFGHEIRHDFPYAYFASDTFQHQTRAEWVKDAGNFKYEAPYISRGFENTVGRYPPVLYHLAVIMSNASGLEVYDAIYLIVFLFAGMGAMAMYLLIKDFNQGVAFISLPLSLMAVTNAPLIGFTWGHWPSLLAQSFLIAFAWAISKSDLQKSYILIAVLFTSIALTHTSEAVFAMIFVALFFGLKLISRQLQKAQIINVSIAFALSLALASYYLIIFQNTWAIAQPFAFGIEPVWQGNPGFYMIDFGILLVLILIGILLSLFRLKEMHASVILAFSMLIAGFLNYAGFGLRSFQVRFFWPVYLSVFLGFAVYTIGKLVIKRWNIAYSLCLFVILTIMLAGIIKLPLIPHYSKIEGAQGAMNPYHWKALEWLSRNTETNSRIYFLYGDIYGQDALLRNSKRVHYLVDPQDFANSNNQRELKSTFVTELPGDSGGGVKTRKGIFEFEDVDASVPAEYFYGPQDICKFDYIVLDKISRQQPLASYNLMIASELLEKGHAKIAFENEVAIILKNNKPGDDCIEERNF